MSDTEPSDWSATLTWTTAGAMVERRRVAAVQCRANEAMLAQTVEVDSITWDDPKGRIARASAKVSIAHTGDYELGDAVRIGGDGWGKVTAIDADAGVVTITSLDPPPPKPKIVVDGWARPPCNRHERRAEAAKARRR